MFLRPPTAGRFSRCESFAGVSFLSLLSRWLSSSPRRVFLGALGVVLFVALNLHLCLMRAAPSSRLGEYSCARALARECDFMVRCVTHEADPNLSQIASRATELLEQHRPRCQRTPLAPPSVLRVNRGSC